jgi:citrate lyase synthetase
VLYARTRSCSRSKFLRERGSVGFVLMHRPPFKSGHQYLAEKFQVGLRYEAAFGVEQVGDDVIFQRHPHRDLPSG